MEAVRACCKMKAQMARAMVWWEEERITEFTHTPPASQQSLPPIEKYFSINFTQRKQEFEMEIPISKLRVLHSKARSITGKVEFGLRWVTANSFTCRCKCGNSSWASVSCNVEALAGGHDEDIRAVISILA